VIPAYFHPTAQADQWQLLVSRPERIRLVIINPATGPGRQPDRAHATVLDALRTSALTVCGYVDTNYGGRAIADVAKDFVHYQEWYGVDALFLDRVATSAEDLPHYAAVSRLVRTLGATSVMFNHGAYPHEAYSEYADLLGTFEGSWHEYQSTPSRAATHASGSHCHFIHSVPRLEWHRAMQLAEQRGMSHVYVTDRSGVNPYRQLPSLWLEQTI
jgi:hypothetical protein